MQTRKRNDRVLKVFSLYSIPTSIIGLWPLAENTLFRKLRVVFCVLQTILAGAATLFHLLKNTHSISDFMDSVIIISFVIMNIIKVYILYSLRGKLATVLNSAYIDWVSTKNERDVKIMKDHLQVVTKLAIIFYGTAVPCTILYISKPFLLNFSEKSGNNLNETNLIMPRNYIMPGDFIFDSSSDSFYHAMLFNQIFQAFVMALVNIGTDMMYIAIITHICGQIEILIVNMEELGKKMEANQDLDNLIKRHQHLMSLTQILEDVYNKIIFVQMLMAMFFISTGGISLLLSLQSGDTMNLTKDIMIIQFMLMQSYLYTYPADNLANLGEKMLRGIYNSQWYELPTSLTKNLVFMMMRLNIPPYLTAGKFFYLTRRSYTIVIKTGASYLSVLRIMINRI